MQKITACILLLTHVFSAMGMQVDIHYCGKNKTYSAFGLNMGKQCACKHKDQTSRDKCCKEKKVEIKSNQKESLNRSAWVFKVNQTEPAAVCVPVYRAVHAFECPPLPLVPEHPPDAATPVYLLNSVFLI